MEKTKDMTLKQRLQNLSEEPTPFYRINSKKGRLIASLFYLPFRKTQNII